MTMTFQQTDTDQAATLGVFCSTVGGTVEDGSQCTVGGSAGSTERTFTVGISQADDAEFSYECIIPADTTWGAGNWTINITFSTGHMDVTLESVFVCKDNGLSPPDTLASSTGLGVATDSSPQQIVVNQASSAGSGSGTVVIVLGFSNSNSMFTRDIGITPDLTIIAAGFTLPVTATGAGYYQHYYRNLVLA